MSTPKKVLTQEVASATKDWLSPMYLGIARSQDPVLLGQGGTMALQAYRDLERDAHAHAILQKRKFAIVGRPWEVLPASDKPLDKQAAELVEQQLKGLGFDLLCLGLLDAQLMGFSVAEIMWEVRGGQLWAAQTMMRRQERFIFRAKEEGTTGATDPWELRLRTISTPLEGDAVPACKFITHRTGALDNNPYGLGLGNQLYWPVEFKRQGLTFWLIFADKFGSPTVEGEYETGATTAEQTLLLQACQAFGQEAAVVHPKGMTMKLLEATRTGSIDTYDKLVRYMDEQMSEAVLGETGSTNQHGSGGSRARDQVGNEVRLEVAQADADLLSATLNTTLVKWIVDFNLPGAGLPQVWRNFDEPEDLKAKADRDLVLSQMGFQPTLEYVKETYGGEYNVVQPAPVPPSIARPSVSLAEGGAEPLPDAADRVLAQAAKHAARAAAPMLNPIRKAVMEAKSLPQLRDTLDHLYPELDASAFAELMDQAMTVAALAGRFEVLVGH